MFAGQKILLKQENPSGAKKRIAVIGCGVAGLVSMKTALEYGHDVTGFEKLGDIGGIWNFKCCGSTEGHVDIPDPEVNCYPTYNSLITNTSEYLTMFSDFMPVNAKSHDFLRHDEICAYLKAYADHFNLLPNVRLQTYVKRLDKLNDKWQIHYKVGSAEKSDLFDIVMICTGAFGYPYHHPIEGKDQFKGLIIHSAQVRNGGPVFKDKRALIIGGAYSGGEMMAMALANGVKKLYVSATNRPESKSVWSIARHIKSAYGDTRNWDYCMNRENAIVNPEDFGSMLSQWCYPFHKRTEDATLRYPGDALALTDLKEVSKGQHSGVLEFVDPVVKFGQNSAYLRNETELSDLDVVICATGYDQKFPFLDHVWPRPEQIKCELYNYTMSPRKELDGLAFILATPSGFPLFHSAEMQTRWFVQRVACRNYYADGRLFDEEERKHMEDIIAQKHKLREGTNIRFNYIDGMHTLIDYLAADIGAQPPDYKELVASGNEKNAELGVAIAYGPLSGIQYRVQGPHACPQAADECIALAKRFLGNHFDEYLAKAKTNIYPRSGVLDPKKGPYNKY